MVSGERSHIELSQSHAQRRREGHVESERRVDSKNFRNCIKEQEAHLVFSRFLNTSF